MKNLRFKERIGSIRNPGGGKIEIKCLNMTKKLILKKNIGYQWRSQKISLVVQFGIFA